MARKRKDVCATLNTGDEPRIFADRNEIMKLTKIAKSWEFTCSFCFKKFPSAQAMGGHQNAHRNERLEEKRLFVRDPIGYRKRAYLRAMNADQAATVEGGGSNHLHAASKMVKDEVANKNNIINADGPPKITSKPVTFLPGGFGEFNAAPVTGCGNNYFSQPSSSKDSNINVNNIINGENLKNVSSVAMNFLLPPKGLSLAESVCNGVIHAEDAKGKACIEFVEINVGCGVNMDQKLDLTLKL